MTGDRERLRGRLLAFAGVWLLLTGLLAALSLVIVALAAFALPLLVILWVAGIRLLRRLPLQQVRRVPLRLRTALDWAARADRRLASTIRELGLRRRLRRLGARAREATTGAPVRATTLMDRGVRGYAVAAYRLRGRTEHALRADGRLAASLARLNVRPAGQSREALELNELGAKLRRDGDPEKAAEQHREALEILRHLGDEQAEAMTLNNLALALAQGGAEEQAVEHLERALVVLRELGDEEHEGLVIANLGSVHRRQGHTEEAVTLLHEALDKLPPESTAYRQVEEELRRAS